MDGGLKFQNGAWGLLQVPFVMKLNFFEMNWKLVRLREPHLPAYRPEEYKYYQHKSILRVMIMLCVRPESSVCCSELH